MYGLLLEAIADYLMETYGTDKWDEIRKKANINILSFATHTRYPEKTVATIAKAASEVTGEDVDTLMMAFGTSFVTFMGQFGYDKVLSVLGRHLRDFLNGLDNLHEYLRFSYPKLRPPSFFVENESKSGLTLHYRSKRRGYIRYVEGQIIQVAKSLYETDVEIEILSEEETESLTHVIMRLRFDNTAYAESSRMNDSSMQSLPLRSDVFFQLFPFHIVFNRLMTIRSMGSGLSAVIPLSRGKNLKDIFQVVRPLLTFTWESIMGHTNNIFELVTAHSIKRRQTEARSKLSKMSRMTPGEEKKDTDSARTGLKKWQSIRKRLLLEGRRPLLVSASSSVYANQVPVSVVSTDREKEDSFDSSDDEVDNCLHLKGQMMFMTEWDSIIFLGTPVMENLDAMSKIGLFINDLSMHDSSRDLVLAGTQQSAELKLALDQEQQKSKILEESMQRLDEEMKRTDQLLYQMIPKPVADRLRSGEPAMSTCQTFENVSILFSDVVGFTHICSQITPMEVVSMLNAMYTKFDYLSERHNVYKVETIGDAYMVVSGAPEMTKFHAMNACDMALSMLTSMSDLRDPSTGGNMKIRVGIHSGSTVAGVVGVKMPRYCLFGDTVNTASRMETNSEMNKIHISQTTYEEVVKFPYEFEERGSIVVKGKGDMKTYWLKGKRNKTISAACTATSLVNDIIQQSNTNKEQDLDVRSLYSPVSFEDINKAKSPKKMETSSAKPSSMSLPASNTPKDLTDKNDRHKSLTFHNIEDSKKKTVGGFDLKSQTCVVL